MEENLEIIHKKRNKKEKNHKTSSHNQQTYYVENSREENLHSKGRRKTSSDASSDSSLPSTLDLYMEKVEPLNGKSTSVSNRGSDTPDSRRNYSGKDCPDDALNNNERNGREHRRHRSENKRKDHLRLSPSDETSHLSPITNGLQRVSSPSSPKRLYNENDSTNRMGTNDHIVMEKCRQVFKDEMMVLRSEVDDFRRCCYNQIFEQRAALERMSKDVERPEKNHVIRTNDRQVIATEFENQMKEIERNSEYIRRRQSYLEKERTLLEKEEQLAKRQKSLEEYEEEIMSIEKMLKKRQEICNTKQKDLDDVEQELKRLHKELQASKQADDSAKSRASARACENWETLKARLLEQQGILETRSQKYRTELASATATIAGKDLLIKQLQQLIIDHEQDIRRKDNKLENLQLRLTGALTENIKLESELRKADCSPASSSKSNSPSKQLIQRKCSIGSARTVFNRRQSVPSTSSLTPVDRDIENNAHCSETTTAVVYSSPQAESNSSKRGEEYSENGHSGDSAVCNSPAKIVHHPLSNWDPNDNKDESMDSNTSDGTYDADNRINNMLPSLPENTSSSCIVM